MSKKVGEIQLGEDMAEIRMNDRGRFSLHAFGAPLICQSKKFQAAMKRIVFNVEEDSKPELESGSNETHSENIAFGSESHEPDSNTNSNEEAVELETEVEDELEVESETAVEAPLENRSSSLLNRASKLWDSW